MVCMMLKRFGNVVRKYFCGLTFQVKVERYRQNGKIYKRKARNRRRRETRRHGITAHNKKGQGDRKGKRNRIREFLLN